MFPGPGEGFKNFENRPMFDSAARVDGGSWAVGGRLACLRAPWRFIAAKSCTKARNSVELVRQGAQPRGSIGPSRAYPSRNRRTIRLTSGLAHPLAISFATARRRPALLLSQAEGGAVCLTDREHADQWQASLSFHLDVKQFAGLIKEITRSFFDAQHRMQPRAIATRKGHAVALYDFLRCTSNCARPQAAM